MLLTKQKLNSFFSSTFAGRMFNSDNIYREIKVSTFVKANDIYDIKFNNDILVQGIADCVLKKTANLYLSIIKPIE